MLYQRQSPVTQHLSSSVDKDNSGYRKVQKVSATLWISLMNNFIDCNSYLLCVFFLLPLLPFSDLWMQVLVLWRIKKNPKTWALDFNRKINPSIKEGGKYVNILRTSLDMGWWVPAYSKVTLGNGLSFWPEASHPANVNPRTIPLLASWTLMPKSSFKVVSFRVLPPLFFFSNYSLYKKNVHVTVKTHKMSILNWQNLNLQNS